MLKNFKLGFTLIELLTVMSIIGILSSVSVGSLNQSRAKARDAKRISDLKQIAIALQLYKDEKNNWVWQDVGCGFIQPTGCGSNPAPNCPYGNSIGDGNGYFNRVVSGGYDTKSIAQCLVDAGTASGIFIDPSGAVDRYSGNYYYMKSVREKNLSVGIDRNPDNDDVCIYARLESLDTIGSEKLLEIYTKMAQECGSNYGLSNLMNYYIKVN